MLLSVVLKYPKAIDRIITTPNIRGYKLVLLSIGFMRNENIKDTLVCV